MFFCERWIRRYGEGGHFSLGGKSQKEFRQSKTVFTFAHEKNSSKFPSAAGSVVPSSQHRFLDICFREVFRRVVSILSTISLDSF